MSDIIIIGKMVTEYKGYTIVFNPFSEPESWLVYLRAEFIAKVTWLADAWAIIDARENPQERIITVEALP